ncbi:HTH-type transcriptional activator RhaR [Planctomycetes bacterium Poly30]|uniref:HTH-type transcriptional activator RhaR n=1 Tax=Saltatorellus ferox TaxID=2528018 RepID=A0A518EPF7_9BACT|nr:HTH-type transcriptional activator RhaR [Planctomycetes bacterium Poly30]
MPIRPRSTQPTSQPVEHIFPDWGVDVFESHHTAGWTMPAATHDFLKIVVVHDGEGALARGDERVPCKRGDALVIPAGTSHEIIDSETSPMSLYVVSIRPRVMETACLDAGILPTGVLRLGSHSAEKIERSMRRLLFEQTLGLPTTGAQMVALALRLLVDVARVGTFIQTEPPAGTVQSPVRGTDSSTRMRSYVEDLSENFFEATNLDSAASMLGLSRRRFTQLFREVTGTSWLSYVRKLRIDHAKKLLESTDRTVLSVAFECGFEDLSTFYRAFKRETDESPNKWRTTRQDDEPGASQNLQDPAQRNGEVA